MSNLVTVTNDQLVRLLKKRREQGAIYFTAAIEHYSNLSPDDKAQRIDNKQLVFLPKSMIE